LLKGRLPADTTRHLRTILREPGQITSWGLNKMRRILDQQYASRWSRANVLVLNHMCEQTPNPSSRVLLDAEKDMLGMNRICLQWRLTAQDIRSMIRAQEIIGEELQRAGLGRLLIQETSDEPPEKIHGGWHHMGTTRMHENEKQGVVDRHGKVHGMSNLFISGSSVFPTCGYANPVLTSIALAIRLADHVKRIINE
jgi:choline dehydrogenase-like flavoprotein